MKNTMTGIIILVSIAVLVFVGLRGIQVGSFEIPSISRLTEKNEELNAKIDDVNDLVSFKYAENVETLEETFQNYLKQKQTYEELVGVTNNLDGEIYETKQYDIGYLWRVLGKYATNRKLSLGIDVKKNTVSKSYNINFAVSGKYVNISQFITDIENDSDLYFRIYNFKISGNGEVISATFTVKNINIDPSTIS